MIRAALAASSLWFAAFAPQPTGAAPSCQPAGAVVRLPEISEASGIAASRSVPGRLWAHKDSGEPALFALDSRGAVSARLAVAGAKVEDWEAIAVGPCAGGSCVFIGDIGDNDAHRDHVTVYRVAEPGRNLDASASVAFQARYPDGPQDAEALLVTPDGRLFIVTKGVNAPVALYAFPRELRAGAAVQLERVGQPRDARKAERGDRVTDGSVSADGRWVVLRTTEHLAFHRAADLLAGNWREASRVDLRPLGEPQGEGVTFGPDNVVYLAGEGGGKGQPGTFARLTCK